MIELTDTQFSEINFVPQESSLLDVSGQHIKKRIMLSPMKGLEC